MKKKTLLQKAKASRQKKTTRISTTNEQIELAIAWVKGEISTRQVAEAINEVEAGGRVLYRLAVWLREGYYRKTLTLKQ